MVFLIDISDDDVDFNEEDFVLIVRKFQKYYMKESFNKFNKGKQLLKNFISECFKCGEISYKI